METYNANQFKDTRAKHNRSKNRYIKGAHPSQRVTNVGNNTSSSSQIEAMRGVIDVADSSDDRYNSNPTTLWLPPRDLDEELNLNDKQLAEHPQLSAGDYKLMSQMPVSIGAHFQFSSEKNWDTDELLLLNTEASEYFTLNLKLLNAGLQSIPFYKRMDYGTSMFNIDQLHAMDKAAETAEQQYQKVLLEHESNPKIRINSGSVKKTASAKSQRSTKLESKAEQDDELDELLSMTANSVAKVNLSEEKVSETILPAADKSAVESTDNVGVGNKEDIQQWLDNVLEE